MTQKSKFKRYVYCFFLLIMLGGLVKTAQAEGEDIITIVYTNTSISATLRKNGCTEIELLGSLKISDSPSLINGSVLYSDNVFKLLFFDNFLKANKNIQEVLAQNRQFIVYFAVAEMEGTEKRFINQSAIIKIMHSPVATLYDMTRDDMKEFELNFLPWKRSNEFDLLKKLFIKKLKQCASSYNSIKKAIFISYYDLIKKNIASEQPKNILILDDQGSYIKMLHSSGNDISYLEQYVISSFTNKLWNVFYGFYLKPVLMFDNKFSVFSKEFIEIQQDEIISPDKQEGIPDYCAYSAISKQNFMDIGQRIDEFRKLLNQAESEKADFLRAIYCYLTSHNADNPKLEDPAVLFYKITTDLLNSFHLVSDMMEKIGLAPLQPYNAILPYNEKIAIKHSQCILTSAAITLLGDLLGKLYKLSLFKAELFDGEGPQLILISDNFHSSVEERIWFKEKLLNCLNYKEQHKIFFEYMKKAKVYSEEDGSSVDEFSDEKSWFETTGKHMIQNMQITTHAEYVSKFSYGPDYKDTK